MARNDDYTWSYGGVIRGPRDEKKIALIFTGGSFAEGLDDVLAALKEHQIPGAFFFTGTFVNDKGNEAGIKQLIADGHYLGPHSDQHLLYAPWDNREKTLVTREEFVADLQKNVDDIVALGFPREEITWWIPPYEWYNNDISRWSAEEGIRLFNFSPGTLSHTDYTLKTEKNYRDSDTIWNSIFEYEEREADGMNGFILLTHVGAGEQRPDKFFLRLSDMIAELERRGYSFVRVDEMLKDAPARES